MPTTTNTGLNEDTYSPQVMAYMKMLQQDLSEGMFSDNVASLYKNTSKVLCSMCGTEFYVYNKLKNNVCFKCNKSGG
jgi:hypothetical protein